jgi:hypothetical protein
LTVFAPPPIKKRLSGLLFFENRLATDTQTNTGNGFAARLRDSGLAFLTMRQALTIRQPTPGQLHGIPHTGVNLILHRPVTRPTTRHHLLLRKIALSIEMNVCLRL